MNDTTAYIQDNQFNNNIQINSETNTPSHSYPLRILTQNIQGLNDPTKQQQVLNQMSIEHIDILGLSETKLNITSSKLIFKNNQQYKAFFNNDSDSPRGSGVGIIISNTYAKYIQKVNSYKGRCIYIDLFMKGKVKLRIMQIYLPATTTNMRSYTSDIQQFIYENLKQAVATNTRIILMGDFNAKYEEFISEYRRNHTTRWWNKIFQFLHRLQLVDTIQLFHDINPTNPFNTFIPKNSLLKPTRIDYIWISRDLIDESINSNIYQPELYNTDHNAVYLSLYTNNIFQRKSVAKLKQQKIT
ncbi:MAG TPA: endonuclease/exonuclease/phosphatase family protein, partial [Nitrososphaeraceae archaeon]|nr:endonuclease/exonuclease/phosphatase family protein [Nitrososphaeraceae archaeon]